MKVRVQIKAIAWSFASSTYAEPNTSDVSANNPDVNGNYDFPIEFVVEGETVADCNKKVRLAFEKLVNS